MPFPECALASAGAQFDDALARLPGPAKLVVMPPAQDGLVYDPLTLSITGKPTRTGDYFFTAFATNGRENTLSTTLTIHVDKNPRDIPVFKSNPSIATAMPGKTYRLNLMTLIEPLPEYGVDNQIRFRIVQDKTRATWLTLDEETSTVLQGQAPLEERGVTAIVALIASSNTGGDSLAQTIQIPVVYDPAQRPQIASGVILRARAGDHFEADFLQYMHHPVYNGELKIIIDKIKPHAPWLGMSLSNPAGLRGGIPADAFGQKYRMMVHAHSQWDGDSETVPVVLKIAVDKNKKPVFNPEQLTLPVLYPGQAYCYDFAVNRDVMPVYDEAPYQIAFAKNIPHPDWLRLENNQLIADQVPMELEDKLRISVVIKNIPGGKSRVYELVLYKV